MQEGVLPVLWCQLYPGRRRTNLYKNGRVLRLSPAKETTVYNRRIITAYHEAAHAVVAMAANWYAGQFVEIDPLDLPDLAGVHRVYARAGGYEQPYQRLEIGVGGFLVCAAGCMAERRLFSASGWSHADNGYDPWTYDNDDDLPVWESFYSGFLHGQTDPDEADDSLMKACIALGRTSPTLAMRREIEDAAEEMVTACWTGIERLANALDKTGRVEALEQYWEQGSIGVVERLCEKWVRRFARWHPEARSMRFYFDEPDQ